MSLIARPGLPAKELHKLIKYWISSQIDEIQASLLKARIDGFLRLIISHSPGWHFGCEEYLVSWNLSQSHSIGARLLVSIYSR